MALKDYYLVLGVPRDESAAGIRAAYRDLAKRHHPDVAGDSDRFRELAEAYEVLSDPNRRKRYNTGLDDSEQLEAPGIVRMPRAEPLTRRSPSIFDDPGRLHPSFEEMFDRYLRNYTGIGIPKSEHEEGLNIEVVLSPEEAARGGALPVTLPFFAACPVCRGSGQDWPFPCLECGARGLVEHRRTVPVEIPPGVRPGAVFELPLRGLGIHNFYLRIHISIDN